MNETSASIPRAERKHTPRLTRRAWVGRAIVFVLATAFGRMAYDGYVAVGLRSWERTGYQEFAILPLGMVVLACLGVAVSAVVYFAAHINERK